MGSKVAVILNKLRKDGQFCDVVFELENGFSKYAHFCVVTPQSEFLGAKHFLQKSLQFSIHNPLKIKVNNFSCSECLNTMVDFFYQDMVSILKEHETHFKELVKMLSVSELIKLFCLEEGVEEQFRAGDIKVVIENEFEGKHNYYKIENSRSEGAANKNKKNFCNGCNFKCYKVQEMVAHLRDCKSQSLTCCLCDLGFFSSGDYLAHIKQHEDPKPFFCIECDQKFSTKAALHAHTPKHSLEAPFKCHHCNRGFKWKHSLSNHLLVHNSEKQMLCDICGWSSNHMKALKAHKLTHAGELFKCTFPGCSHKSTRKENLKIHIATHSKEQQFVCEVCGCKFSQNKNLKRHALKHTEAGKASLKCQLCSYSTHRSDKLSEHVERVHTEKPIQLELPEQALNSFDSDVAFDVFGHASVGGVEPGVKVRKKSKISEKTKRNKATYAPKKLNMILPKPMEANDEKRATETEQPNTMETMAVNELKDDTPILAD